MTHKAKTRLRIGMRVNEIGRAHATSSVEGSNILRQVCDYLTLTDRDNITHPVLLERWDTSEDLKTWTLHIRPEARWRSGRPFLADDVMWNIKHVLDPATGSSVLGLMRPYMMVDFDDGAGCSGQAGKKSSPPMGRAGDRERWMTTPYGSTAASAQLAVPEHHVPLPVHDDRPGRRRRCSSPAATARAPSPSRISPSAPKPYSTAVPEPLAQARRRSARWSSSISAPIPPPGSPRWPPSRWTGCTRWTTPSSMSCRRCPT